MLIISIDNWYSPKLTNDEQIVKKFFLFFSVKFQFSALFIIGDFCLLRNPTSLGRKGKIIMENIITTIILLIVLISVIRGGEGHRK